MSADGGGAGDVEETYAHNVRGWLTEQHSPLFHSSLRYDGTTLGTAGLYSGNIAEWEWRRGPGSQANAWALSYDGASRMTDARRYTGSLASSASMTASTSAEVNPFSERAISYDRNGNITALTRYGQAAASAEDILAYTYSGNRIASIANSGTLGGGGSYSHDANGNVTHDGLAGLDLQYNILNLTKRISSGGTTLADYHYHNDRPDTGIKVSKKVVTKQKVRFRLKLDEKKMNERKCLSEHPFGTVKRAIGMSYLLLKSKKKVIGETALMLLSYNLRRAISIKGVENMVKALV